jgi:hypothetical protein
MAEMHAKEYLAGDAKSSATLPSLHLEPSAGQVGIWERVIPEDLQPPPWPDKVRKGARPSLRRKHHLSRKEKFAMRNKLFTVLSVLGLVGTATASPRPAQTAPDSGSKAAQEDAASKNAKEHKQVKAQTEYKEQKAQAEYKENKGQLEDKSANAQAEDKWKGSQTELKLDKAQTRVKTANSQAETNAAKGQVDYKEDKAAGEQQGNQAK